MTDEAFLALVHQGQNVAAFLVAVGVAGLLLGDFVSRPITRRLESARETEFAQIRKEAEALRRDADASTQRITHAETQAAEANQRAELERLARLKAQENLTRRLTRAQQASISSALRSYAGQKVTLVAQAGDPESVTLTNDLVTALGKSGAGWEVFRFSASSAATPVTGILIETNTEAMEAARALAAALSSETLDVAGPQPFPEVLGAGNRSLDASTPIKITIGRKP
jgi:hypothetical protein